MKYNQQMEQWIINNYPLRSRKENTELFNKTFNCNITSECLRMKAYKLNVNRIAYLDFYTNEQTEWLKNNYPIYSNKKVTELFNQTFNTNKSMSAICNKAGALELHYNNHYYTNEQLNWIKENYSIYSNKELVDLFNKKFNKQMSLKGLHSVANRRLKLIRRYYTDEQIKWLKKNAGLYKGETLLTLFNLTFKCNKTLSSLHTFVSRLGIKLREYTDEQIEWLKENASKYTYDELFILYKQTFNSFIKFESFTAFLRHKHIYCTSRNPESYTDEQLNWLKENYPLLKNTREIITEKFNKKFNTNKSKEAITAICGKYNIKKDVDTSKYNFPCRKRRCDYEEKYGKLPEDVTLTDVGNGEIVPIKTKYVRRLNTYSRNKCGNTKLQTSGELTKLFYKVYETEDLIKDKKEVKDGSRKESKL